MDDVSKNLFTTKTFWAAILGPLVGWIGTTLFHAQPDTVHVVVETLSAVAPVVIGLRMVTKTPVHIAPQ